MSFGASNSVLDRREAFLLLGPQLGADRLPCRVKLAGEGAPSGSVSCFRAAFPRVSRLSFGGATIGEKAAGVTPPSPGGPGVQWERGRG